jgi:ATP-dependent DNA ligase
MHSGSLKDKKSILKGKLIIVPPIQGKDIIKIIIGEMRIGMTEGLLEVAVSRAFDQDLNT